MKGRYPVCCLFLEIDPAAVDVNIHPAKREVKFHREFEIRKFVAQAVRDALLAFHAEPAKPIQPPRRQVAPSELKFAPEISAPALPNFPEKLKPSPATPPQIPPAAQTPLKMGFSPASASDAANRKLHPQSSILHPRRSQSAIRSLRNSATPQLRNPQSPRRCSTSRSGSSASSANFMSCWNPTADWCCWTSTRRTSGFCSSRC